MSISESRWFKVINEETGLAAIVVSAIFFVVLAFIYIVRIRKKPLKIFSFYTDDYVPNSWSWSFFITGCRLCGRLLLQYQENGNWRTKVINSGERQYI